MGPSWPIRHAFQMVPPARKVNLLQMEAGSARGATTQLKRATLRPTRKASVGNAPIFVLWP